MKKRIYKVILISDTGEVVTDKIAMDENTDSEIMGRYVRRMKETLDCRDNCSLF